MTKAHSSLVSVSDPPYYHRISRRVRRAFLRGEDRDTGKSFGHRREWVVEHLATLVRGIYDRGVCLYGDELSLPLGCSHRRRGRKSIDC